MKNIAYVIWMIGWPFSCTYLKYLERKWNVGDPSITNGEKAWGIVIEVFIWIIVGIYLFE